MAAVHHQHRWQSRLLQGRDSGGNACRVVIRLQPAAAQNDVAVRIARRANDAGDAILVDAKKTVRRARRGHRVDGDLQAAIGRVFESDGHRQAAGHLAVRLRFRRARADRGPTHQVGDVLGHDGIEKFGRRRQTHSGDFQEQLPRFLQTHLDVVGAVEMRVVNQPLPANGRPRFLEIDAHDDFKLVGQFRAQAVELLRVFQRTVHVVNGARADDQQQTLVFLAQYAPHGFAALDHCLVRPFSH